MGALTIIGLGVVLVGMEFRLNAIDVLADPLGWLLVALGAWMLAARGASALALLAAPLSAAGAYLTFSHGPGGFGDRQGYDPIWSERLELVAYARVAVMAWLVVVLLVFGDHYPRTETHRR